MQKVGTHWTTGTQAPERGLAKKPGNSGAMNLASVVVESGFRGGEESSRNLGAELVE